MVKVKVGTHPTDTVGFFFFNVVKFKSQFSVRVLNK